MTTTTYLGKCSCCGQRKAIGVASSPLGPMSNAYCSMCLTMQAEPEWLLRHTYYTCHGEVATWVREQIWTYLNGKYLSWDQWLEAVKPSLMSFEDYDKQEGAYADLSDEDIRMIDPEANPIHIRELQDLHLKETLPEGFRMVARPQQPYSGSLTEAVAWVVFFAVLAIVLVSALGWHA